MNRAVTKGSDEIKVMYTNINGIISRKRISRLYKREETRNCMPNKQNYVKKSKLTLRMIIIIYGRRIEKTKKVVM